MGLIYGQQRGLIFHSRVDKAAEVSIKTWLTCLVCPSVQGWYAVERFLLIPMASRMVLYTPTVNRTA